LRAICAPRPFPFDGDTLHAVYSEHVIEHLSFADGLRMLAECHRVLRPGGHLRIATPDLAFLIALYREQHTRQRVAYLRWATGTGIPEAGAPLDTVVINHFMRAWGHQSIYDEKVLRARLAAAGFTDVVRCPLQDSAHELLRNLANVARMPAGLLELETLVLEGTKPGAPGKP
jgi:predicted SAM-dependent methyltransferase